MGTAHIHIEHRSERVLLGLGWGEQMEVSCIVAIQSELCRSGSGNRDNNSYGALLVGCFSFGLDDFIWPSIWIGISNQILDCSDCLILDCSSPCPVSQRRLFWPVQCHINFTRGSVIQTVWGGRWPEESRFQSPAESSLRRVVVVCGSDLPKSDSGTFLGPLLRPHDTTRLASHLRRRVESGLCQTVQYRHIYMQAVVTRLVLPVLSFVRSLVSLPCVI